jgi:hypothetical protein
MPVRSLAEQPKVVDSVGVVTGAAAGAVETRTEAASASEIFLNILTFHCIDISNKSSES